MEGRYSALSRSSPKRSTIHAAMLWMEMNALVDGSPSAIASMTKAASSRPSPVPPLSADT